MELKEYKKNMNTDLHKRLEAISENACHCTNCTLSECRVNGIRCAKFRNYRTGITDGLQLGYKEAIKVAKEWLTKYADDYYNSSNQADCCYYDVESMVNNFETNMNKLLEEKK